MTAELRRQIPAIRASTNGRDRVTRTFGESRLVATDDAGTYRIELNPRFGGVQDRERHDEFTATNITVTIANHFAAKS